MTVESWLVNNTKILEEAGIKNPRLDLLILLEQTLGKNRALLLANSDYELQDYELSSLSARLNRRLLREPLAYILNEKYFYGRKFFVDDSVLIPRPESESFIDLLKRHTQNSLSLLDIGTGSGCLAITAKLELPDIEVTATDISEKALEVAQRNAKEHSATVSFMKANLVPEGTPKYDVVLANLPYVPKNMKLEKELEFEPKDALFAENDGLELIQNLIQLLPKVMNNNGLFLCESLVIQHLRVKQLAAQQNLELVETAGLVQLYKLR